MCSSQYEIIVETLTGSELEMTVSDNDTIGFIKARIQKYEGIPMGQQHLLYNHKELSDTTEMKDIPLLSNGLRLKLVLDMKGGPVSARRIVSLPEYDNWYDLSDVLNSSPSGRYDHLTITTPSCKMLLYKDPKKNVHRIMKLRSSDRKTSQNTLTKSTDNSSSSSTDNNDHQWIKENLQTLEKMNHLRLELEKRKKNRNLKKQNNQSISTNDNKTNLKKNKHKTKDKDDSEGNNDYVTILKECLRKKPFTEKFITVAMSSTGSNNYNNTNNFNKPVIDTNLKTAITTNNIENNNGKIFTKLSPMTKYYQYLQQIQQHPSRKNSFEFPISAINARTTPLSLSSLSAYVSSSTTIQRKSLSSSLLNKYGLNKTCIRPPSFVSCQLQQQPQKQCQHKPIRKNVENNFQLNTMSPLLPQPPIPPGFSGISMARNTNDIDKSQQLILESEKISKDSILSSKTSDKPLNYENEISCDLDLSKDMASISSEYIEIKSKLSKKKNNSISFDKTKNFKKSIVDLKAASDSDLINHLPNFDKIYSNIANMKNYNIDVRQRLITKLRLLNYTGSKSFQDLIEKIAISNYRKQKFPVSCSNNLSLSSSLSGIIHSDSDLTKMTTMTNLIDEIDYQNILNKNQELGIRNKKGHKENISTVKKDNRKFPKLPKTALAYNSRYDKIFVDRYPLHKPLSINAIDTSGGTNNCINDIKVETGNGSGKTSALDTGGGGSSFRLYKMASAEAKSNYELPKLLIREDSPVESFHLSDPQLETLTTIRGESPKTSPIDTSFSKLRNETETDSGPNTLKTVNNCSRTDGDDEDVDRDTAVTVAAVGKSIIKSPWNYLNRCEHHHHSDLELNFLNDDDYSNIDSKDCSLINSISSSGNDNVDLNTVPSNCCSVLKISSNLEVNNSNNSNCCWNSNSSGLELEDRQTLSQPSTNSLNFINGDLICSDYDEEDGIEVEVNEDVEENLFNSTDNEVNNVGNSTVGGSCCMLHSNSKSKSIEVNDFRMMFGSSPTLLNSTNYNNSLTNTSRLDAVPIHYRRGYTNLNDACLSSSTSDLELFNGVGSSGGARKKNSSKSASQELPSAYSSHHHSHHHHHNLHHHHHHHHERENNSNSLDLVRSYENLDRAKILQMKNEYHNQVHKQHHNRNLLLSKNGLRHFWDNKSTSVSSIFGSTGNKRLQKDLSQEKLQEEDFYIDDDIDFSYANLGYDNSLVTTTKPLTNNDMSTANSNSITDDSVRRSDCLPFVTGFSTDESLFNMDLDKFASEFNLLSTTTSFNNLNDGINIKQLNSKVNLNIDDDVDIINDSSKSSLLLTEFDIDSKTVIKKFSTSLNKKQKQETPISSAIKNIKSDSIISAMGSGRLGKQQPLTIETTLNDTNKILNSKNVELLGIDSELGKTGTKVGRTSKGTISASEEVENINEKEIETETKSSGMTIKSGLAVERPKKVRCTKCNKKLGLIIMKCHCEKVFCSQHRYAEAHNCSYDFKLEGKKVLEKENPLVIAQKINKI